MNKKLVNLVTGEVIYLETSKAKTDERQRAANDLMKIAEELDNLALRLYNLGGNKGVNSHLRGNLEAKAEMISVICSDILKVID